ncbi:MAG: histidine phosphatase family protein [Halomonadaceae bacterium]|nr:MAG: histidine phosphatase family protein [Halomonadaceae bacterium]
MKQLTLIRHGKSSWDDPTLGDIDRPLGPRGLNEAPLMGQRLAAGGLLPDLILCSPACRTLDTARLMAHKVGYSPDRIRIEKHLYLASMADMIAVLHLQDDHLDHLWLVGHNPDLLDLANHFAQQPIPKLPTAAVCTLGFNVGCWHRLAAGQGQRQFYDSPKRKGLGL